MKILKAILGLAILFNASLAFSYKYTFENKTQDPIKVELLLFGYTQICNLIPESKGFELPGNTTVIKDIKEASGRCELKGFLFNKFPLHAFLGADKVITISCKNQKNSCAIVDSSIIIK